MTTIQMRFSPHWNGYTERLWCDLFQFTVHVIHILCWRSEMHLFYLFLSTELLNSPRADALLWYLSEWGLPGSDSQWCFNDRPVIAVMCGVHSQHSISEGFIMSIKDRRGIVILTNICCLWLNLCPCGLRKVTENTSARKFSLYTVLKKKRAIAEYSLR